MQIVKLSTYSGNTSSLNSIPVQNKVNGNIQKDNLIKKEYYKKEEDGTFSYNTETMIVVEMLTQDDVPKIKVQPVINLVKNDGNYIAKVSDYSEILYYIDNKWHTEDDLDKDITCENVVVINPEHAIKRTIISRSYLFEVNGDRLPEPMVVEDSYRPEWCI